METHPGRLVVHPAEASIESRLVEQAQRLGAHTCEALGEHLQKSCFAHYSISRCICAGGVLRPEKYTA